MKELVPSKRPIAFATETERILRGVVRVGIVVQYPTTTVDDRGVVTAKECVESVALTPLGCGNEHYIGFVVVPGTHALRGLSPGLAARRDFLKNHTRQLLSVGFGAELRNPQQHHRTPFLG